MQVNKIKQLSEREHMLLRPGQYIGATTLTTIPTFIFNEDTNKFEYSHASYVPALLKIISEIIDNALDEAVRTDFKYANKINIEISDTKLTPENLAELLGMIEKNTISNNVGKQIIVDMMNDGTSAKKIVEEKGLSQITDVNAIRKIVEEIVANNQPQVEQYKSGKTNLFGFFVGQAMKATKGKANPKTVNEILRELLDS